MCLLYLHWHVKTGSCFAQWGQFVCSHNASHAMTPDGDERHCSYDDWLYKHITLVLHDILHLLPVPRQIQFRIAFLAFNYIRGAGPTYFRNVSRPTANLSGRAGLHSAERGGYLAMPRTATELRKQVSVLLHRSYGTFFRTICAHPPSPTDSFSED